MVISCGPSLHSVLQSDHGLVHVLRFDNPKVRMTGN